jgi:hypothetical protein
MSDDIDARLAAAGARLDELSGPLMAGAPWPLAAQFDNSPEASWGPRETLAHLEEMLLYWLGEMERVLEAPDDGAPFGRVITDEVRLAIIERDRTLPLRELLARVRLGIDRWRGRWAELDDASRGRTGTHPRLGAVTVGDLAGRFAVVHLEDHLDQLEAAIRDGPTGG